MTANIATHQQPDADALVAAWLASRFLFAGQRSRLHFVPREWRPGEARSFDCVLDVGCAYDVERLWFDHKPPATSDRRRTCASRLLWEYLLAGGHRVHHLSGLIDAVHDGDSSRRRGSAAYRRSRRQGLHAFFHQHRDRCDDRTLWSRIRPWLDRHERAGRDTSPAWSPRWQRYGRGRVYLQALEAADTSGRFDAMVYRRPHQSSVALKEPWDRKWTIADGLAERWEVTRVEVRDDARFAFHVASIVGHCGDAVRVPILAGQWRLKDREIGMISRSAGERQRFEIEEVKAGRRPFRRKTEVFDTHSFEEVISRLQRAEGLVRKGAAQLAGAPEAEWQWAEPLLQNLLALCRRLAGAIRQLDDPSGEPGPLTREDTEDLGPRSSVPAGYRTVRGKLAAASQFLKKNGRDVVRLPPCARPKPDEVNIAIGYVGGIEARLHDAVHGASPSTRCWHSMADPK